jgi:hypothetical protein
MIFSPIDPPIADVGSALVAIADTVFRPGLER